MTEKFFTIDWADFKELLRDSILNNSTKKKFVRQHNRTRFLEWSSEADSWKGYTIGQLKRWITEGYTTDAISGLGEFIPPIRDKRKLIFAEEGDEFHYDIAASGDENYMSSFTKRESIPGVALEACIMFSGAISASVVNAYEAWICKVAFSLETSGIDTQITLDFPSMNLDEGNSGALWHNIVRVKKENEASDFLSWSSMLSPAGLRSFGFALGALHCDAENKNVSRSFGRGIPHQRAWTVSYNHDRRTIEIKNAYMGSDREFPEAEMTRQLRNALKEMQGKLTNA